MKDFKRIAYLSNSILAPSSKINLTFKKWSPSLTSIVPPNKPFIYIIYSFFYFLNIFKKDQYFLLEACMGLEVVSSMLVVPKYFKWPFMSKNSVQFTYIMSHPNFRKKGLASRMLYEAYIELKKVGVQDIWYVTDNKNIASNKLASKNGFEKVGNLKQEKYFFGFIKVLKYE